MTRTFCFSKELAWKCMKSLCESLLQQIIKSYNNKHNKSIDKNLPQSNSIQIAMVLIILRPPHPMQSHTCWRTNTWQIMWTLRAETTRFFILEPQTILQLWKIRIKTMVWVFMQNAAMLHTSKQRSCHSCPYISCPASLNWKFSSLQVICVVCICPPVSGFFSSKLDHIVASASFWI